VSRLRLLGPDDWETWREVRLRSLADSPDAFGSTLEREQDFTEADWRARLTMPAVVVSSGGRSVACGAVFVERPGFAMVIAMWVDPAHRGRGLSRAVLDALVAWAREQGLTPELGVNRSNPVARAAYLSYGFEPTTRTHPLREGSEQVCDVLELRPG
jgi:GNAT superfamily N-acetyltransferase